MFGQHYLWGGGGNGRDSTRLRFPRFSLISPLTELGQCCMKLVVQRKIAEKGNPTFTKYIIISSIKSHNAHEQWAQCSGCCKVFRSAPMPALGSLSYTTFQEIDAGFKLQLVLKGQCNEIFDFQFFSLFESAQADLNEWMNENLVGLSL